MPPAVRRTLLASLSVLAVAAVVWGVGGCGTETGDAAKPGALGSAVTGATARPAPKPVTTPQPAAAPVLFGVDVLEADGFIAVAGKRVGLLTHPAGVNSRGESTIDVLRRAPKTKLVALFGPEHGLYGNALANERWQDGVDPRTGLPVYSLYGKNNKPTAEQLKGLDALVIDLQDIGVRSYTFNVVMRYAIDSCFAHGVEVIVLDRPNPLGGLLVDGPVLDRALRSGVGAYEMPYVHGLTIGELARYAVGTPGVLDGVSEKQRQKGRLTVVPMRGWRRDLLWPDTKLNFTPTSQNVRDFDAVVGYAAVGLGCEYSGFSHGIGTPHPFRLIFHRSQPPEVVERDLKALNIPGVRFEKRTVPGPQGKPLTGVYVEVTDWFLFRPTELSFRMMKLACRYSPPNPFNTLSVKQEDLYNKHVGSLAWWNELKRDGANVDVDRWLGTWRQQALAFREQTRKFWLY